MNSIVKVPDHNSGGSLQPVSPRTAGSGASSKDDYIVSP